MDVASVLAERNEQYGDFQRLAAVSQGLKEELRMSANWDENLTADMRESLEMIAHKMARIVNGDCNLVDSWRDIAGYAELIVRELSKTQGNHTLGVINGHQA